MPGLELERPERPAGSVPVDAVVVARRRLTGTGDAVPVALRLTAVQGDRGRRVVAARALLRPGLARG